MIPRIRELLNAAPFAPFSIRTGDGREYIVPTADHVALHPDATRVFVFFDSGGTVELWGACCGRAQERPGAAMKSPSIKRNDGVRSEQLLGEFLPAVCVHISAHQNAPKHLALCGKATSRMGEPNPMC